MSRCPHHGQQPLSGTAKYCSYAGGRSGDDHRSDRFGRMFDLPANFTPVDVLNSIGRATGKMKGAQNAAARTNTVDVGHVFFGQFIDHDITLDVTSSFDSVVGDAGEIPNSRTPQLDLDCIYGGGPEASPYLYDRATHTKLLHGADDLLRNSEGVAMIGDFRNDENRVVSQLQLGMIAFHNDRVEELLQPIRDANPGVADDDLDVADTFERARHTTTWHYQWCVVFDFLVAMCGDAIVDDVFCNGRKHYCGGEPYIPVEFSIAAYRFGHSMVPMNIQVQQGDGPFELFGDILGRGFEPLGGPRAVVDWEELFDNGNGRVVQKANKLNTKMSPELLDLPVVNDPAPENRSLAARNLRRGNAFLLPAGEVVAKHMGRDQAEIDTVMAKVKTVSENAIDGCGAPLWLYILAEAEVIGRGRTSGAPQKAEGLGPVGGRIVAEVIIGLLELDDDSFLSADRNWKPEPRFDSIGKMLASTQP